MEQDDFKREACLVARRNVSERVYRVLATFDPPRGLLKVVYCIDGTPTDGDVEDCELTCGELLAAFPDIRLAETKCISRDECDEMHEDAIVYAQS